MNVPSIEARHYIAGFTGLNDIGARYSALGPCLVTPDEIGNPYGLEVTVRINGEEFGRTNSAGLRPRFEQTIESLSSNDVILPGDVIAFQVDLRPPVKCGDVIELEIEKIRYAADPGSLKVPYSPSACVTRLTPSACRRTSLSRWAAACNSFS